MSFRDKLSRVTKLKTEKVEIDGEQFTIQEFSGTKRDEVEKDAKRRIKFTGKGKNITPDINTHNPVGQKAMIIAMGLVDDDTGLLAFEYKNKDHLKEIGGFPAHMQEALSDAILELSGMSPDAEEEAEGKSEQAEANTSG